MNLFIVWILFKIEAPPQYSKKWYNFLLYNYYMVWQGINGKVYYGIVLFIFVWFVMEMEWYFIVVNGMV